MTVGSQDFVVHDATAFPLVALRSDKISAGFAARWIFEMEQLVQARRPFVLLLVEDRDHEETTDDRKRIILWCKGNRPAFAQVCRGIVGIEPNRTRRALKRVQAAALSAVLRVPVHFADTRNEAETIARQLLKDL